MITEKEFWSKIKKHSGKFKFTEDFRVRTKGRSSLCPLEVATGEDYDKLLKFGVEGCLTWKRVWIKDIIEAADEYLGGASPVRKKLLMAVGLKERT